MRRDRPEVSGNDFAGEEANHRHAAREAVVRRACEVMGWDYHTSPAYTGIRAVALGKAVAISVEKLHELLDLISPRLGGCEHDIKEQSWIHR